MQTFWRQKMDKILGKKSLLTRRSGTTAFNMKKFKNFYNLLM